MISQRVASRSADLEMRSSTWKRVANYLVTRSGKPCIAFATLKHRSATLVTRVASPGHVAASIGRLSASSGHSAASMQLHPASRSRTAATRKHRAASGKHCVASLGPCDTHCFATLALCGASPLHRAASLRIAAEPPELQAVLRAISATCRRSRAIPSSHSSSWSACRDGCSSPVAR
jgi:hypothetical protein